MTVTSAALADRLETEGLELMEQTRQEQLAVGLLGGMAIRLLLGERLHRAFVRPIADLDVLVAKRDARQLSSVLEGRGWLASRQFNALNGGRRMLFVDPAGEAQVDVFVETFEMCHRLPLRDRVSVERPTLPATDLVMTKLQIVELNAKDRADITALLLGCPVQDGAPHAIEPSYIAQVCSQDWGLHRTFELNLARLAETLADLPLAPDERAGVLASIRSIQQAMEQAPKSRAWRLRAKVGERKRWYELPEEVRR